MTDLGFTYRSQGRLKDFDVLAVRIMELTKTALREEHRDTLGNMVLLSFVWKAQGQNTKAINLLQACIRQQSRILGAQHPDTLILSAELADWQDPGYDSFPTSLFMITKKEPKTIGWSIKSCYTIKIDNEKGSNYAEIKIASWPINLLFASTFEGFAFTLDGL